MGICSDITIRPKKEVAWLLWDLMSSSHFYTFKYFTYWVENFTINFERMQSMRPKLANLDLLLILCFCNSKCLVHFEHLKHSCIVVPKCCVSGVYLLLRMLFSTITMFMWWVGNCTWKNLSSEGQWEVLEARRSEVKGVHWGWVGCILGENVQVEVQWSGSGSMSIPLNHSQ